MTDTPAPATLLPGDPPANLPALGADVTTDLSSIEAAALAVIQRRGYNTTEFWALLAGAAVAAIGTKVQFLGGAAWQEVLTAAIPVVGASVFAWIRSEEKQIAAAFSKFHF
jgi:hypothetical protein